MKGEKKKHIPQKHTHIPKPLLRTLRARRHQRPLNRKRSESRSPSYTTPSSQHTIFTPSPLRLSHLRQSQQPTPRYTGKTYDHYTPTRPSPPSHPKP